MIAQCSRWLTLLYSPPTKIQSYTSPRINKTMREKKTARSKQLSMFIRGFIESFKSLKFIIRKSKPHTLRILYKYYYEQFVIYLAVHIRQNFNQQQTSFINNFHLFFFVFSSPQSAVSFLMPLPSSCSFFSLLLFIGMYIC